MYPIIKLIKSPTGFFNKESVHSDDGIDSYSLDSWGQFQASADSLRGHASLYCISDELIFQSFGIDSNGIPAIYLLSEDESGLIQYNGVILEMNLSEWVLRNSSPRMNELSFATSKGEIFATQFFSSRKLKFILIIGSQIYSGDAQVSNVITILNEISEVFKGIHSTPWFYHSYTYYLARLGDALFSYMLEDEIADVNQYFQIKKQDLPIIVAYNPLQALTLHLLLFLLLLLISSLQ